uniref:Pentacotripeptide-repeat region of PRORP domain-containing protein n=1 Tax=Aegilops tauschii subsp. strangulata TaxID=200361 RepID=A0A453IZQ9_AEGTS
IMLSNLQQTKEALTSEDFSYILEYCAEAPDPLFVMETLELMNVKSIGISKSHYRSVTRALSQGGYSKEALKLLTLLGEKECSYAALPIFNIFLSACSTNLNDAESCLEIMENHLLGKSEITFCELLKVVVLQRNLSAVHDLWKDCTRYYSPSIVTQRKFVKAFSTLGDLQSAYRILQRMVVLAGERTDHLRVSSKRRCQSTRLDIPVPALHEVEDLKLVLDYDLTSSSQGKILVPGDNLGDNSEPDNGRMPKTLSSAPIAVKNVLRWAFNDIIHACVYVDNCQLSEQLFLEMHKIGLRPSRFTYDGFIKCVIAGKGVAHAIKVIEVMDRRGIRPYDSTLVALSVDHSKSLQLDLAEHFLGRISDIQPEHIHAFNALLSGCDIMNEPERALRILAKMRRLDLKPHIWTYEIMFSLFGNVNVPYEEGNMLSHADVSKRISIIEMDMLNHEIRHSFVSMKNLIRAFGAEGMIDEMLRYLNVAENVLWNMDPYQKSDLYGIVLHALVKAKETPKAIRTFKIMRSWGLPTNTAIYNIMIECCKLLPCVKSAGALLSLMFRDGCCPTVVTFTSLLKVVLAKEDFEGALDLLDLCITEGIQPDIEIFNTILSEANAKGNIHVVEYIVECIHRAKIRPDESTLWYTFCAYVDQELYNTALEALQVLSMRMISLDASILKEKGAALEDLILSEDPDAELKIIRTFEATEECSAAALLNLRWCVTMGSTISWSPEDNLWARRLASSYDANKRPVS